MASRSFIASLSRRCTIDAGGGLLAVVGQGLLINLARGDPATMTADLS
jgi:hypothetical protein